MNETAKADRVALIDWRKIVAMDTPERLKEIVKDIFFVKTSDNGRAAQESKPRYQIEARRDRLTFEIRYA